MKASLLGLTAVLLVTAAACAPGPLEGTTAEGSAAPGSLVRWPGEGLDSCGRGEASWTPLEGACWYAIDLLEDATAVEVWRQVGGRREVAKLLHVDYPYPVQYITLEDDSKVNLSEADGARAAREQERIGALWSADGPRRFTLPLATPLEELPEGGRFGSRRFFNNQPRSPHSGSDFAADSGTPVLAAAAGTVTMSDDLFFSGKSVFIHHGDGLITMYFHLSELGVAEGDEVERGQRIGRVGATGRATGPHLHFGARWRGARVDPGMLLGRIESAEVP
jgi:murein DD-endopeptidase MepM/ murein hydrolase activator NlpD